MDVFKIATSLTMSGNAIDFMRRFAEHLGMAHGRLKGLQGELENTRKLAIGVGMAFAGYEGLKGLLHLAEHGKELNHQQSMLLRNGIAYKDVIEQTTKAYQRYTSAVPTASGPDFLRTANELVSVKGTLAGADAALVQSLKIEGLIGNATGKSAEGQGYDFWRAVEDKGVIQNKALTDQVLNAMAQGTIATGGKISGGDWYTYAKRAGTSWMGDALEALPLQVMEMQTMTATGAGTARKTFANMMEGSQKLSKRQLAAWAGVGLLGEDGLPTGHKTEQTRPDLFIQGIIDALKTKGISSFDDVKGWAATAMNRKTSDFFMTAFAGMTERDPETGKTRLEKERANLGRAQGLDKAYDTMMGTDMTANLTALNAQWHSFMEAVGGPLAKAAIPILQELTTVINKMGAFADAHQTMTTMIGDLAAVASGLLILSGSVTALKAAVALRSALNGGGAAAGAAGGGASGVLGLLERGTLMGGMYYLGREGITAALDALPKPNYPAGYDPQGIRNRGIMGDLTAIKDDFKPLADAATTAMKGIADAFKAEIAKLPGEVEGGIASAISAIGAAISGALSRINPFSGSGSARQAAPTPGAAGGRYHGMSFGPPPSRGVTVHTALNIDSRKVASAITRHQVAAAIFPNALGGPDTYGTHMGPGVPMTDAA